MEGRIDLDPLVRISWSRSPERLHADLPTYLPAPQAMFLYYPLGGREGGLRGVWGPAFPQESESQSERPRVRVRVERGAIT
jgi:hypothetical protein